MAKRARRGSRARARRTSGGSGGTRQSITERIVIQTPRSLPRRIATRVVNAPIVVRARAGAHHHASQTGLPALIGTLAAGYLLGKVDGGSFPFPTIPGFGRAGTIAVVAGVLAKKHPIVAKLAVAASAIAGYEFGRHGTISGEDTLMGGVVSQV